MRRAWTAGQGGAPSTLVPGGAAVSTHFTLNTHTCRYLNDISVFLSNTSALEWIALICRVGGVGGRARQQAGSWIETPCPGACDCSYAASAGCASTVAGEQPPHSLSPGCARAHLRIRLGNLMNVEIGAVGQRPPQL